MIKEFREFIMRGNLIDMAVGIIIGVAFGTVVKSLVSDIIMPPVGLVLGNVDFSNIFAILKQGIPSGPYATISEAQAAGAVSINYGIFINNLINFLIVGFAAFMIVKAVNRMMRKEEEKAEEPVTKECPYCYSVIPVKATRCPSCTSELE